MSADPIEFAFARGFGPWLTPLRGKVPVLDAWQARDPATLDEVLDWKNTGFNLGLRCGCGSGLVVLDDDQARHGVAEDARWIPPPTGLVAETPTGGRHYFYIAPDPCPGNSASRVAPYVDVRGQGGQVVYAGSAHPQVKGKLYVWIETGEPGVLAPDVLTPAIIAVDLTRPDPAPRGTGYADTALVREAARVRVASEGTRNDALNRAAFSLGQLVAGGELEAGAVEAELQSAAQVAGLQDRETAGTIRSGMAAGAKSPRSTPTQVSRGNRGAIPGQSILVPGSHVLPPDGEYREQGGDRFADEVLSRVEPGLLYRRADRVGEVHEGVFALLEPDDIRLIVDERVRLGAGKDPKTDDPPTIVYRNCSRDHAGLILSRARKHRSVRKLHHLAAHPILIGDNFETAKPGWNPSEGVLLTMDHVPDPLDLTTARAVLEDLVCDFPFQEPSDRANFFGLMLTPLLRVALRAPVPMHLINSPVERSGKTKLAETVLGCVVLGSPTPAMQLGQREEEREKRIMSTLLEGRTVLHLDNLEEFLGSPSLASLLTSSHYMGRILGATKNVSIANTLTIVGTGNNVHATGEIAKRIVPIRLLPPTDSPETREDYRHPHLQQYVEAERYRVLGALLGLVDHWRRAGRPMGAVGFGGFERWMAVVGGIMDTAGYPEWLCNLATWRGGADDFNAEVRELCSKWHARWGSEWVQATALYDLAQELGLFGWLDRAKTERGRRTSFGMRCINKIRGRTVLGKLCVEVDGVGEARQVRLAEAKVPKV